MKETLSTKELKKLHELQAKQKRIKYAEKKFLQEADKRKKELLERWGIMTATEKLPLSVHEGVQGEHPAEQVGCSASNRSELLLDAATTDPQEDRPPWQPEE